jgi:hypothetical protein
VSYTNTYAARSRRLLSKPHMAVQFSFTLKPELSGVLLESSVHKFTEPRESDVKRNKKGVVLNLNFTETG